MALETLEAPPLYEAKTLRDSLEFDLSNELMYGSVQTPSFQ